MAQKKLTTNVFVPDVDEEGTARGTGTFYGPDHPENEVTAEVLAKITNPAAFAEPDEGPIDPHSAEAGELRRAAADDAAGPAAVEDAELEDMTKNELLAVAAARGVEVSSRANRAEIIEALTGE